MININKEREKKYNELFDEKQKADEELKKYILYKKLVLPDEKLKDFLKKDRTASFNFFEFLEENGYLKSNY